MPVIPRELGVACYIALPVICVQTKSIDVLKDVYELTCYDMCHGTAIGVTIYTPKMWIMWRPFSGG